MTIYLTPAQAAAELQVSSSTVRRWIRRGELRAVRAGAVVRITHEALTAWVAAHETAVAATPSSAAVVVARQLGVATTTMFGPAPENPVFPTLWGLPASEPAKTKRNSARTKKRA